MTTPQPPTSTSPSRFLLFNRDQWASFLSGLPPLVAAALFGWLAPYAGRALEIATGVSMPADSVLASVGAVVGSVVGFWLLYRKSSSLLRDHRERERLLAERDVALDAVQAEAVRRGDDAVRALETAQAEVARKLADLERIEAGMATRAAEVEQLVARAGAAERALGKNARHAVCCRLTGIVATPDGRVTVRMQLENRLRSTSIRIESVVVRPILVVPGGADIVPLSDVKHNISPFDMGGLDEEPVECWIVLPVEARRTPRAGAWATLTVLGVEGHVVTSGPWGEKHIVAVEHDEKRLVIVEEHPPDGEPTIFEKLLAAEREE